MKQGQVLMVGSYCQAPLLPLDVADPPATVNVVQLAEPEPQAAETAAHRRCVASSGCVRAHGRNF